MIVISVLESHEAVSTNRYHRKNDKLHKDLISCGRVEPDSRYSSGFFIAGLLDMSSIEGGTLGSDLDPALPAVVVR